AEPTTEDLPPTNEEFGQLDVERELLLDVPLAFDLMIYLPKNNKFILYMKKGTTPRLQTKLKLVKYRHKKVYIEKNVLEEALTSYLAYGRLGIRPRTAA